MNFDNMKHDTKSITNHRKRIKNSKGFILSLDIAIAVFVVLLVLAAANQHMIKSETQRISNLQMIRAGSDILAVMDVQGTLASMDISTLERELSTLLPAQYEMTIKAESDNGVVLLVGGAVPDDRFVGTGKRFFVFGQKGSTHYGRAEFTIWRKTTS